MNLSLRRKASIKCVIYLFLYCIAIQRCRARSLGKIRTRFLHTSTSIRKPAFQCSSESYQSKDADGDSTSKTRDQDVKEEIEEINQTAVSNLAIRSREEKNFFKQSHHALLRTRKSMVSNILMVKKQMNKNRIKKEKDEEKEGLSQNIATSLKQQGGAAVGALAARPLLFWENMVCGAISRSVAQTVMHPANTMKTMLQSRMGTNDIGSLLLLKNFHRLSVGAGANFVLSVPHGAVNFAVLEFVRSKMSQFNPSASDKLGPGLDFISSCISTICCSIVSTPQMMITDNIMAGNYPNLIAATKGLYKEQGVAGFYSGWFPGLCGKIPSYALTWTLFQQIKEAHRCTFKRPAKDIENSIMGCIASATTVCIMIPLDTIKTRLVTQVITVDAYKGIVDCAVRTYREEGLRAFYRGLAPRLVSVVPMMGINFGALEFMKKVMRARDISKSYSPNIKMHEIDFKAGKKSFEESTVVARVDKLQFFPNSNSLVRKEKTAR